MPMYPQDMCLPESLRHTALLIGLAEGEEEKAAAYIPLGRAFSEASRENGSGIGSLACPPTPAV